METFSIVVMSTVVFEIRIKYKVFLGLHSHVTRNTVDFMRCYPVTPFIFFIVAVVDIHVLEWMGFVDSKTSVIFTYKHFSCRFVEQNYLIVRFIETAFEDKLFLNIDFDLTCLGINFH